MVGGFCPDVRYLLKDNNQIKDGNLPTSETGLRGLETALFHTVMSLMLFRRWWTKDEEKAKLEVSRAEEEAAGLVCAIISVEAMQITNA